MNAVDQLRKLSVEAGNDLQERHLQLQKELAEAETLKARIEASIEEVHAASARIFSFRPELDGFFQCPSCWVRDGERTDLTLIISDRDQDLFRCFRCGTEFGFDPFDQP
jgi:hypothetical protein